MNNPSAALQPGIAWENAADTIAQSLIDMFNVQGRANYGGEKVSQVEHALQCALLAERSGAASSLVVAALLHDVGHLLQAAADETSSAIDDLHEEVAAQWLSRYFGPEVTEPIRLHVAAKRFLCATDPVYFARLSAASQTSLKLQGGPMSTSEVGKFLSYPHYRDAVLLRRWDDEAKMVGKATQPIEAYRNLIMQCVR